MFNVIVNKDIGRIIVKTDDSSVKYMFETLVQEDIFTRNGKRTITKQIKIYENTRQIRDLEGNYVFIFNYGWASYILQVFKRYMSKEDYDSLVHLMVSDSYRTIPFPGLRDYQNEDILHVLKYNHGLISCFTSYGKTQVIAVLAEYFYSLGKSIMIVTPGKKANEEICKRVKSLFGISVPTPDLRMNNIITSGLLTRKDVKDPEKLKDLEALWASYDVILCDEVEYCVNSDSGQFLFDRFIGAEKRYAFSGTADKKSAEMITFRDGLSENVVRNRNLIKYFGPSTIFRLPTAMRVNLIKIKTPAFANVKFEKSDFEKNVYLNITTKLFTDPMICELMVKVLSKYPKTYIPMNNLQSIISDWIDNYFIGRFRILLICAEGYIYYELDGTRRKLKDLAEACEYVKNGLVDVIPSTSAGFRALDLPGLENVLLLTGKIAGVVLQSIGRAGRGTIMNIIGLDSISKLKIPVYSKGMEERDELIKNYYKFCDIVESDIYDINL